MATLELKDLHVALEDGTEIVKGVSLRVSSGEVHAIMGPNGSGKSTLAYAIAGHPAYEITSGQILLDGRDITEAEADERAQAGLFLAFQYPHAIPGVTVTNFLRQAINAVRKARNGGVDDPMPVPAFRKEFLAQDGRPEGEPRARLALPQRRVLRRREEARRDPADGDARAEDRGARRDRLRARHRRPEGRRRRRAAARRPGDGRARDHALPADPELHQARLRPRLRRRQDRRGRRPGARREARGVRLRGVGDRGGCRPDGSDRIRDRPGDRLGLRGQVRLQRSRGLLLQVRPRPLARARRRDLVAQERARLDAEVPPQVARLLPGAADADVGRAAVAAARSTSRTSTTTSSRPRTRPSPGRTCRPTSRTPGTSSAFPRRRRSTSPASARSTRARSSTTSCRRASPRRA